MKNKIAYLALLLFVVLPALSFGQDVSASFTKTDSSFVLKITNEDTDNEIFVINRTNVMVEGSELLIIFLDKTGSSLYTSNGWYVGKPIAFKIRCMETHMCEYKFSRIYVNFALVKQVKVHLFLKYLKDAESYIYQNDYVVNFWHKAFWEQDYPLTRTSSPCLPERATIDSNYIYC